MNLKSLWPSIKRALCLLVAVSMVAFSGMKLLNAQSASARAFVSSFYNWYAPLALQDHAEPTWHIPLREKKTEFDPTLVRLLQADVAAQSKCEDLVGLDFDPFLNSQDPSEKYEVGDIKQQGDMFTADIFSVQAGERNRKPDVIASFKKRGDGWLFLNFYYSNGGDLMAILKAPKLPCSSPRPSRK